MSAQASLEYRHELLPGVSPKADRIKSSILSNKRVTLLGEVFASNQVNYPVLETVDFFVAPVTPMWTASKLSEVMEDLSKDIPFEPVNGWPHFNGNASNRLILGRKRYSETLANTKKTTVLETEIVDVEALNRAGHKPINREEVSSKPAVRISTIRLFPDAALAGYVSTYERWVRDFSMDGKAFADGCLETLAILIEPRYLERLRQVLSQHGQIEQYLSSVELRQDKTDEYTDEWARKQIEGRLIRESLIGQEVDVEQYYRVKWRYMRSF